MKTKVAFRSEEGKATVLRFYDSLLENWISPNEKLYVDTRYGKTFIIASGDKEAQPLILLHGSAMNSFMWYKDVEVYSRIFRVYAVDIPGEPGKSDERQLPFEGLDFIEWLEDVYKALSIENANLIGISLGGWISIKFSAYYPDKVNKLVLLCPAGVGKQRNSIFLKAMAYMIMGEKGMDKLYRKVNGNKTIPEKVLEYQKLIGKNFHFRKTIIPLFSDVELKKLTMPTMLYVGEKDIIFHSEMTATRIRELVPNAKINILSGMGHTLLNLSDEINEFLLM